MWIATWAVLFEKGVFSSHYTPKMIKIPRVRLVFALG
jgi:hypothetical protein